MKICGGCGVEKPLDDFHRSHNGKYGRQGRCKDCVRAYRRSVAGTVVLAEKFCGRCETTKPIEGFAKNASARDGHQAFCRLCSGDVQREYEARHADLLALRRTQRLLEPVGENKTKVCRYCNTEKPLLEFYAHRGTADKRANKCKRCAQEYERQRRAKDHEKYREYLREWRAANPDRQRQMMRNWRLKLYGLTSDDYIAMYEQQDGRCKICGQSGEAFGGRRLHIDHDHDTGKVRGLLCGLCNTGIGHLGDSPERLRIAASYLEEARTR